MIKMFVDSEIERIEAGKSSPLLSFIVLLEPVLTPRMVKAGRFYCEHFAFKGEGSESLNGDEVRIEIENDEVEVKIKDD